MKEKIITLIKRVLMGFGGLFLVLFILVAIFGSTPEDKKIESIESVNIQTEKEVISKEIVKEKTVWTIDAEEFEWTKSPVQIWAQADPHRDGISKPIGQVGQYDKVEFIEQHQDEMYCKITFSNVTGYIACSWLKEAPQEWKDLWKF